KRGFVDHTVYDHTSVLKAIEWRWGLPSLTPRDAAAANIVQALDFTKPANLSAPAFTVPQFVAAVCPGDALPTTESGEWSELREIAISLGWSLPS
ncbi:MAG: phospholipase, partial [Pseudonocardiales bacterium]|nr:phospholipase [Pseudonocardiales bacterium]